MLLKLRVRNFAETALTVDAAAIAAFESRCRPTAQEIAAYLLDSANLLDADAVQQALLPAFQADVFLSHGTVDREQVLQLAVMLERVGLTVFVDSCLWQNVYALQQAIDERYSARGDAPGTHHFQHRRVALTSASVCMVLNAALQRMIDGCELFLHLEGEAVGMQDCLADNRHAGRPWVFSELMFARHLPRRGRPPLMLDALKDDAYLQRTPFAAPEAPHVLEWDVLLRAIADISGFPPSSYWRDHPLFLDHLYGKLPLSPQQKRLLGWM